jgi:hypothetical protein
MRFDIRVATHRGKQITVVTYRRTLSGVEIKIIHNVPSTVGKQLRWVQTISENGSFFKACGKRTYVDPFGTDPAWTSVLPSSPGVCKADDLKPFYETDPEFATSPNFDDSPSEGAPVRGRTWLKFVTALTEVTGTTVMHLVAVRWGFDRLAGGEVRADALRTPTPSEMKEHGRALKLMYPKYTFI